MITEIRKGESQALASLYDEASPLVYSLALRIVGNPEDAEEVTVDVFTQVWKNSHSWNATRGSATSWLILLARSRALDKLRWRKSRTRLEDRVDATILEATSADDSETAYAGTERRQRVQRALAGLSEAQRAVLELAFYSGLTHQEIADRLAEPLGTIKSRIRTAMLKMKEALA
jgi:RNA polymerase sigma-70 factor (ECF subfamily)